MEIIALRNTINQLPVCTMTAAESEDVPISKIAGPKEPVAKITAVDVEPTAKPIKIPEIGAKKVQKFP